MAKALRPNFSAETMKASKFYLKFLWLNWLFEELAGCTIDSKVAASVIDGNLSAFGP